MPDNFEGYYYLIIAIDNLGTESTSYIDSTPMISLASQDSGTTSILDTSVGGVSKPAERPDASEDGRFVTFEKTQTVNGRDLAIYIIDMGQPDPEPKLISRAYNSSYFFQHQPMVTVFDPKLVQMELLWFSFQCIEPC